jgi:hypothetical protein
MIDKPFALRDKLRRMAPPESGRITGCRRAENEIFRLFDPEGVILER